MHASCGEMTTVHLRNVVMLALLTQALQALGAQVDKDLLADA